MDPNRVKSAADAAKANNRLIYAGIAGAALVGYYMYKKREGDVQNVGDAAAKTGASIGRGLERTGDTTGGKTGAVLKDEGKGFQAKQ